MHVCHAELGAVSAPGPWPLQVSSYLMPAEALANCPGFGREGTSQVRNRVLVLGSAAPML